MTYSDLEWFIDMKILKVYEYWWSMMTKSTYDPVAIMWLSVLFSTSCGLTIMSYFHTDMILFWILIGFVGGVPLVFMWYDSFVGSWKRIFEGVHAIAIIRNINKRCIIFTNWDSIEMIEPSMSIWFKKNCIGEYYYFYNRHDYRTGVIITSDDDLMRFKMVYC